MSLPSAEAGIVVLGNLLVGLLGAGGGGTCWNILASEGKLEVAGCVPLTVSAT